MTNEGIDVKPTADEACTAFEIANVHINKYGCEKSLISLQNDIADALARVRAETEVVVTKRERGRADFYKKNYEEIKDALDTERIEEYINTKLKWSADAADWEKSLVAGNIRAFALWAKGLNKIVKPAAYESNDAGERP